MEIRDRIKELRRVPASALQPNPRNWRKHPAAQNAALLGILEDVGYAGAVLARESADGSLVLIDGHARAGLTPQALVPTLILDVTEAEADRLLASYDPIGAMAERDSAALSELLQSIGDVENERLDKFFDSLRAGLPTTRQEGLADPDHVPPVEEATRSVRGDLWLLGNHRLLCGDATSPDDVSRLMAGKRAELFVTDPPYLVDYDGSNHPGKWDQKDKNKDWDGKYGVFWDESRAPENIHLYDNFMAVAKEHAITPDAAWYCWHAGVRSAMVQEAWERAGAFVHQQIVWVKDRPLLTRSWYMWQHEPCFFGWIRGNKPPHALKDFPRTVWEIPTLPNSERPDHPTPKPVQVFEIPIEQHLGPRGICYDPFVGSGSQIIAAERLGRACYALEIDPRYVDVSVKRWEAYTGQSAKLATGGG